MKQLAGSSLMSNYFPRKLVEPWWLPSPNPHGLLVTWCKKAPIPLCFPIQATALMTNIPALSSGLCTLWCPHFSLNQVQYAIYYSHWIIIQFFPPTHHPEEINRGLVPRQKMDLNQHLYALTLHNTRHMMLKSHRPVRASSPPRDRDLSHMRLNLGGTPWSPRSWLWY